MGTSTLMRINAERRGDEFNRVESAVSCLLSRPAKVDFYSVSAESGVSRSTLYRNLELRRMVEAARDSQPDPWVLIGWLAAENELLSAELASVKAVKSTFIHECVIDYDIMDIPLVA